MPHSAELAYDLPQNLKPGVKNTLNQNRNLAQPNSISTSREFPFSKMDQARLAEIGFDCLCRFVKWHLSMDQTLLLPSTMETYGKFMNLPFDIWVNNDHESYDELLHALLNKDVPAMPAILCSLGGHYVPAFLRRRLTGPSLTDVNMPPLGYERHNISLWSEYEMLKRQLTEEEKADKGLIGSAMKGMIACYLQSFFFQFLCQRSELISTFNHPAAHDKLDDDHKLAVGVMREVLILPHFGSMYSFWMKHTEMIREGGKLLGAYPMYNMTTDDVRGFLGEDSDSVFMLQLCLDVGMERDDFKLSMTEVCRRFN